MKHLKIFENYDSSLIDFFKKMGEYYRIEGDSKAIDIMNFYKIPENFEEEIKILNYLYSPSRYNNEWKTGYKKEDNSIKRKVKKLTHKQILDKFTENPELCDILNKKFENPKWIGNHLKEKVPDKFILFAFRTTVRHSPEWMKSYSKYNL